jgi:cell division initiation protein
MSCFAAVLSLTFKKSNGGIMRIAPIDIAHKNFGKKMMGFDTNEVIEFLRDIADQMEDLIRERNTLKEAMREKEMAIMEYRERDETLKATITTATRMAEQIRQDSEREAKIILSDSQQKAELIVKDARDSLKRIYQEISDVKRARLQFEANVRSLAQAHLAILDHAQSMLPEFQMSQAAFANSQQMHANTMPQNPNPQPNHQFQQGYAQSPAQQNQQQQNQQQQLQNQAQQQANHNQQLSQNQPSTEHRQPTQAQQIQGAAAAPTRSSGAPIAPLAGGDHHNPAPRARF